MRGDKVAIVNGKKTGLMSRIIRREVDEQNPELKTEFHYIIHQQSLCGKTQKYKQVMKVEL
jgi:hypothetical protein